MTQPAWPARLTKIVASQVRRYRGERGMSAQQVADRCAELGMGIPRSTLADLENGRRASVTLAELLVLAAALNVPPVLLVAPLGHQPTTEILPGREMLTWDAVLWQSGETRMTGDPSDNQTDRMKLDDEDAVVPLYHEHDRLVDDCEAFNEHVSLYDSDGKVVRDARDLYLDAVDRLRQLRVLMSQRGLLLPSLPARLAEDIDSESARGRRR